MRIDDTPLVPPEVPYDVDINGNKARYARRGGLTAVERLNTMINAKGRDWRIKICCSEMR